jgi:hypothetical protein
VRGRNQRGSTTAAAAMEESGTRQGTRSGAALLPHPLPTAVSSPSRIRAHDDGSHRRAVSSPPLELRLTNASTRGTWGRSRRRSTATATMEDSCGLQIRQGPPTPPPLQCSSPSWICARDNDFRHRLLLSGLSLSCSSGGDPRLSRHTVAAQERWTLGVPDRRRRGLANEGGGSVASSVRESMAMATRVNSSTRGTAQRRSPRRGALSSFSPAPLSFSPTHSIDPLVFLSLLSGQAERGELANRWQRTGSQHDSISPPPGATCS